MAKRTRTLPRTASAPAKPKGRQGRIVHTSLYLPEGLYEGRLEAAFRGVDPGSVSVSWNSYEALTLPRPSAGFAYMFGRCSLTCSYWQTRRRCNADVIENRTLAAASVEEAVRTATGIVLNTPVPGIYGFRLMRNGLEVFHWFIGQDDASRP